jgi:hypothetical protein
MQAVDLQKTTETFTRRAKCRESFTAPDRNELDYFRMDKRVPGVERVVRARSKPVIGLVAATLGR